MSARAWIDAGRIVREQKKIVLRWHEREGAIRSWEDALRELPVAERSTEGVEGLSPARLRALIAAYAASIARINTYQWHEEDKARDPAADDAAIAAVKRVIDASNQRRVDEIERLDTLIGRRLAATPRPRRADAVLSSETPGSMVDRLSILALKLHHTQEHAEGAKDAAAKKRFIARLSAQREQARDLRACFDELMSGVLTGERRFKLYFQFKMYNDPETNPYMRRK